MRHETHIPAQQNQAQENVWIPRPHEDSRRPQGDPPPPSGRPQKLSRLTYPKRYRLRKRSDFLHLQKKGQRLVGKRLCIDYRPAESAFSRLGITASSRYGDAPERSRFKRLVREAFRKSSSFFPSPIDLNVIPRQRAKGASAEEIRLELVALIRSAAKDASHAQS